MSDISIYENLANAIILHAVKDYRMALKSLKANPRNRTAQADKAEIERFFRSQWYSALTDVNGEMLHNLFTIHIDISETGWSTTELNFFSISCNTTQTF